MPQGQGPRHIHRHNRAILYLHEDRPSRRGTPRKPGNLLSGLGVCRARPSKERKGRFPSHSGRLSRALYLRRRIRLLRGLPVRVSIPSELCNRGPEAVPVHERILFICDQDAPGLWIGLSTAACNARACPYRDCYGLSDVIMVEIRACPDTRCLCHTYAPRRTPSTNSLWPVRFSCCTASASYWQSSLADGKRPRRLLNILTIHRRYYNLF